MINQTVQGTTIHHIIIIISGSTILAMTLATWHQRFLNLIKTYGRIPLDKWLACRKGLHLYRATQHRNTKANIHAPSRTQTHDPRNQAAKNYTLDRAATGTLHHINTLNWWWNTYHCNLIWHSSGICCYKAEKTLLHQRSRFLFMFGLLDNSFNSSDYIASNTGIINKLQVRNNMEGSSHGLI
jgi:hypothetical protein